MEKHQVVPDVIPVLAAVLEVKFGSHKVDLGNVLTPSQVKSAPRVSWSAEPGSFYTLCIKGTDMESGDLLSAYIGSAPPKGSRLHRYVLQMSSTDNQTK